MSRLANSSGCSLVTLVTSGADLRFRVVALLRAMATKMIKRISTFRMPSKFTVDVHLLLLPTGSEFLRLGEGGFLHLECLVSLPLTTTMLCPLLRSETVLSLQVNYRESSTAYALPACIDMVGAIHFGSSKTPKPESMSL